MNKKWTVAAFLVTALPLQWLMAQENSTTTPTAPSAYEQQKQAEEIRGLRLQNDKLAQENRAGKAKAVVDALPASPTSGAITVKDGAGQAEANVLALSAASKLAKLVAARLAGAANLADGPPASPASDSADCRKLSPLEDAVSDIAPAPQVVSAGTPEAGQRGVVPVLLISGAETLSFSRWDQFRFRACKIASDYETAIDEAKAAAVRLRKPPLGPRQAGGSLTGVATAISAAVKLAQLGIPDWEVANLQTSVANRPVLLEVADAYRGIEPDTTHRPLYWQGAVSRLGASARIFKALDLLGATSGKAEDAATALGDEIGKAEKRLAAKKPKPHPDLAGAVAEAKTSKATLDAVIAAHAALLKDLYGGDAASPLPIAGVVSEAAAASLLGSRGVVASINVESSGGTSAARKGLVNIFHPGTPPLYISGSVSISYAAIRPGDQQLLVSGAYSCSTGAVRLRSVPSIVNPDGNLSC
jgi:hypothetical protein